MCVCDNLLFPFMFAGLLSVPPGFKHGASFGDAKEEQGWSMQIVGEKCYFYRPTMRANSSVLCMHCTLHRYCVPVIVVYSTCFFGILYAWLCCCIVHKLFKVNQNFSFAQQKIPLLLCLKCWPCLTSWLAQHWKTLSTVMTVMIWSLMKRTLIRYNNIIIINCKLACYDIPFSVHIISGAHDHVM